MLLSWIHRNKSDKTAEPPDTHDKGRLAQSGESLAKQKPFPDVLRKIRDLSGLPQVHFNQYYHASLLRFLALTQFADAHFLHIHLLAVIDALKMRRSLILPTNSDAERMPLRWYIIQACYQRPFKPPYQLSKRILVARSPTHRKQTQRTVANGIV